MNYKEIIQNILTNGQPKQATRLDPNGNPIAVENGTIGTFCEIFRHDMSKGFPLTTLRKMPWKSIRVELEFFIKGLTSKEWLESRNCKFWSEWGNPLEVDSEYKYRLASSLDLEETPETRKEVAQSIDDLGPVYGYQWRYFNREYIYDDKSYPVDYGVSDLPNGLPYWTDQLKSIVNKLHNSPHDRRMICSAWNPNQEHLMALPPCHYSWGVVVYGGTLNLHWNQRSVDSSHGLPTNIASYALLMMLLCEESGLKPGELVGKLEDCHLYNNTIDSVKVLIERDERDLPQLKIKRKEDGSFSIFDWTYDEVELIGYDPHPPVNMGAITV